MKKPEDTMTLEEKILSAEILIVDDEPINVQLLERTLKKNGYTQITSTSDPRRVIPLHLEKQFDLILLDIQMPYLDGFEVMEKLKEIEIDSYLPILVLTALTDRETRLRALKGGAKDFLTKPIDRIEILHRIHNMLEVRMLHNEIRDQNKILEERVLERTHDLHETRFEVIQRLGRAAEYRDNETGLHIMRMSRYSMIVGKKFGLNDQESKLLLHASPMHDVGKIGISDSILLKPGRLTKEEFDTMKTHTTIGADILSNAHSELLEMALLIAITHHEKWDGSGYPNGLKGDDIPLVGRIVAICDVFDALTSKRPYKTAWTTEDALAEIKNTSGKHFDAHVVDCFFDSMPEIISIKDKYAEPA